MYSDVVLTTHWKIARRNQWELMSLGEQSVITFMFVSQVPSKDGRFNFSLNICGPVVPTDVPLSGCNPQGVCGHAGGAEADQGKEHQRISSFRI
jgi:hypothetical protein